MNRLSKFTTRMAMLTIAGAALSACTTMSAGNSGPTFQDYLSIEDAMHAYHYGLDNHDDKLKASAFTKEGRLVTVVDGMQIVQYPNQPEKNSGSIPGAPPAGGPPPGGPPGGFPAGGPPSGGPGGPGAGGPPPGGVGGFQQPNGELWHLAYPGHLKFESATRVTNYGYWTSLYSEAKGPRDSQVGSPGTYVDILEKQPDGRWLFVERKIIVGSKK